MKKIRYLIEKYKLIMSVVAIVICLILIFSFVLSRKNNEITTDNVDNIARVEQIEKVEKMENKDFAGLAELFSSDGIICDYCTNSASQREYHIYGKEAINMLELERRHHQVLDGLQVIAEKLDYVNYALDLMKTQIGTMNKNIDKIRRIEKIEFLTQ